MCPHGMPSPGSCVDCMDKGLLPVPPRPSGPTVEFRFEAKFPVSCRGCNLPIHEGQRIARLSDETYCHSVCEP